MTWPYLLNQKRIIPKTSDNWQCKGAKRNQYFMGLFYLYFVNVGFQALTYFTVIFVDYSFLLTYTLNNHLFFCPFWSSLRKDINTHSSFFPVSKRVLASLYRFQLTDENQKGKVGHPNLGCHPSSSNIPFNHLQIHAEDSLPWREVHVIYDVIMVKIGH